MKVQATKMGFYGLKRVKEGTVFALRKEKDFSETWMEKVDGKKVKKAPAAPVATAAKDEPKI